MAAQPVLKPPFTKSQSIKLCSLLCFLHLPGHILQPPAYFVFSLSKRTYFSIKALCSSFSSTFFSLRMPMGSLWFFNEKDLLEKVNRAKSPASCKGIAHGHRDVTKEVVISYGYNTVTYKAHEKQDLRHFVWVMKFSENQNQSPRVKIYPLCLASIVLWYIVFRF